MAQSPGDRVVLTEGDIHHLLYDLWPALENSPTTLLDPAFLVDLDTMMGLLEAWYAHEAQQATNLGQGNAADHLPNAGNDVRGLWETTAKLAEGTARRAIRSGNSLLLKGIARERLLPLYGPLARALEGANALAPTWLRGFLIDDIAARTAAGRLHVPADGAPSPPLTVAERGYATLYDAKDTIVDVPLAAATDGALVSASDAALHELEQLPPSDRVAAIFRTPLRSLLAQLSFAFQATATAMDEGGTFSDQSIVAHHRRAERHASASLSLGPTAQAYHYLFMSLLGQWALGGADELIGRAREAGQRAVDLDPKGEYGHKSAVRLREMETELQGQSSTKSGGCYIATSCYGSYDHPDVLVLRRFRDERLLATGLGRLLVAFYYSVSPAMARSLAGTRVATAIRTWLLVPLVCGLRAWGQACRRCSQTRRSADRPRW